ncbi:Uncharacterised protein [Pseudomonas aeruginosa]|nr:Uncharacterised protein [Pseudomonas aeruginosa]
MRFPPGQAAEYLVEPATLDVQLTDPPAALGDQPADLREDHRARTRQDGQAAFGGVFLDTRHARQHRQRQAIERVVAEQGHRLVVARAAGQLQRRAVRQQAPAADHQGAAAERRDLLEDMGGDDHDAIPRQPADQLADLVLLVRIEAVGGLVENQRGRLVEDRLGQADAPAEALGQGLDGLPAHLAQLQQAEHPSDPLALAGTTVAADLGDEIEEPLHGHFRIAGRTFRKIADEALRLQRAATDVEAEDARRAGAGREEAGKHLHGGGLAGAVRAEEAQHLSGRHPEGQVIHHRPRAEAFAEVRCFDHGPLPVPAATATSGQAAKNAQGL